MFFEDLERSDPNRLVRQLQARKERKELLRLGVKGCSERQVQYRDVMRVLKECNNADIEDAKCQIVDLRSRGLSPLVISEDCLAMYQQTRRGGRSLMRALYLQTRRLAQIAEENLTRQKVLYRVRKLFTPIQYLMHGGNPMPIVLTKNGERIPTRRGQFIKTYKGWYVVVDIIDFDYRDLGKRLPPMRRRVLASPCSCNLDFGRTDIVLFEEIEEVSNKSPEERKAEYDSHEHMLWWYANHPGE